MALNSADVQAIDYAPNPSASLVPPVTPRPTSNIPVVDFLGYLPRTAESRPAPPDGQERKLVPINETGLPDEIVAEQTSAMESRINRLIKLSQDRTIDFDALMQSDIHFMDRELLNLLTNKKPDGHGGERYTGIDRDALQKFMGTSRGQEISYAVRMNDLMVMAMGAAVRISITPNSGEPRMIQGESTTLAGRGVLRGIGDRLADFFGQPALETEGRQNANIPDADRTRGDVLREILAYSGAGGLVGMGVGAGVLAPLGPLGMVVGGVGGALLPPAVAGIVNSLRAGKRIEISECVNALQTLTGTEAQPRGAPRPTRAGRIEEAQREWLRQFAGIDPTDLEVYNNNGQQAVRFRPNHIPHTLHDGREMRDRLVAESNSLRKIQSAMGVPTFAEQGTDIDWIMNGNNGPQGLFPYNGPSFPGQRSMDWDRKVANIYNPNRGGVRFFNPDANEWQTLEVETAPPGSGVWVTNPYLEAIRTRPILFSRNRAQERLIQWDLEGNARRYLDAYRVVLRGEIGLAVDQIRNGNTDYLSHFSQSIAEQLTARGESGEARRQRVELAQRDRERFDTLLGRVGQEGWTNYETAVGNLNTARENVDAIQQALNSDVNSPTGADLLAAIAGRAPGISEAEAALRYILNDSNVRALRTDPLPATIVLGGERIGSIQTQLDEIDTDVATSQATYVTRLLGAPPRAPSDKEQEQIDKNLERLTTTAETTKAPIIAQQEAIRARLKELDDARNAVRTQERALADRGQINADRQRALAENETAFLRLLRRAGIPQAHLATLTFDEIQQRVNTAGLWPEADNGFENNQQTILRAMIDARSRQTLPVRPVAYRQATMGNWWGLSENQLLTLPVDRLRDLMTQRLASAPPAVNARLVAIGGVPPTDPPIQALKDIAAQRMRIRGEAITSVREDLTLARNRAQAQETARANPLEDRPLQMMKRTITQWGKIDGELANMQAGTGTDDLRQLTDRTALAAPLVGRSEYVPEELNANVNAGYIRWLNVIFDYQRANDLGGRGTAFEAAMQLVPPDLLAERLADYFNLPAAGGILAAFTNLDAAIAAGSVSTYDIRRFIQQNIVLGYLAPLVTTY